MFSFYPFQTKHFSKISEDLKRITILVDKEEYTKEHHREYAEQLVFLLEKDKALDFKRVIYNK